MKTITFYSYKGGVGRSLILANVAKRLTEIGKNVCMLDFDLEAPGLEFKFLNKQYENEKKGVVDFITSYTDNNILPQDIVEYTSEVKIASRKHHGWLKLIKAGQLNDASNYWRKLMSIDWKKLFYTPEGRGYELILHLKALIEQQVKPDYLLVDSRTGITETSGITLSILADEVVLVAANNEENFFGSLLIAKSIRDNTNGTIPKVHFVLSRVPFTSDPKDREKEFNRIKKLKDDFKLYYIIFDEIYVVHSDRELEEEESLKIGEIERDGEICIENDYLLFFDGVIRPDLSISDLEIFTKIARAEKLLQESESISDPIEKIKLLDESIKLDPENELAYFVRAEINSSIGKVDDAEKDYLEYFEKSFRKTDFEYYRVVIFYYSHKRFTKLIEFSNKNPIDNIERFGVIRRYAESLIGRSYTMLEQYSKAFEIYEKLLKEDTLNPEFNFNLGDFYFRKDQINEAEKYLNTAISKYSNYTEALYTMAIIQSRKERKQNFYIYFDRALESDKTNETRDKIASEPEFKKYYKEEAFQRILYKYNIRLKTEE